MRRRIPPVDSRSLAHHSISRRFRFLALPFALSRTPRIPTRIAFASHHRITTRSPHAISAHLPATPTALRRGGVSDMDATASAGCCRRRALSAPARVLASPPLVSDIVWRGEPRALIRCISILMTGLARTYARVRYAPPLVSDIVWRARTYARVSYSHDSGTGLLLEHSERFDVIRV
jgi:hypothetical protein